MVMQNAYNNSAKFLIVERKAKADLDSSWIDPIFFFSGSFSLLKASSRLNFYLHNETS
jgi:hypothetical protein